MIKTQYRAESGHWYAQNGDPAYTIVGANGNKRNTTLRDARKHALVPSVTSVLGIADKPALTNWKLDRALEASLRLSQWNGETDQQFIGRCKREAKKIGQTAAKRGSEIHAKIELGFLFGADTAEYVAVRAVIDELYPNETWHAEASFCTEGYGGKIDLHSDSGIFIDFKTKDNLDVETASRLVYDEHGMQLSAYANGKRFYNPERCSIFIDRDDVSKVCHYVWDKETHKKHLKMFKNLLEYWQLTKNYQSGETI